MSNQYGSIAVQGLFNSDLVFSSNITTTSATDVVMTGMTATPPGGTYLVIFSTWLTHSTGNATVTISVYAGGVQQADSIRTTTPFCGAVGAANNGIGHSTNNIVTVSGSQAIALEWHTSTGTATAHNGTFNLIKIG